MTPILFVGFASGSKDSRNQMGINAAVKKKAVFLDRDGVINQVVVRHGKSYPPSSPSELVILPGVSEALLRLRTTGFLLIVVTNQPDVARGQQSRDVIDEMHAMLRHQLPLDDIFVCFHDDRDQCDCRKPKSGLLLEAADKYSLSLSDSFMIGDRWRDIDAGARAGCRTVFIDRGYQEKQPAAYSKRVTSLAEAVDWIFSAAGKSITGTTG